MYTYRIHKNHRVSSEKFSSAVNSAKNCVESVLYDFGAEVLVSGDLMRIKVDSITEKECRESIRGCFCDGSGNLYPEFLRVEPLSKGR